MTASFDFLNTYAGLNVTLGLTVLGLVCGSISIFAVLRRQSLIGDVVAHAALPGIVLAYILFRQKETYILLLGAFLTGWVGMLFIGTVTRNTKLKNDSAFAIILSVFFGIGVLLMSYIQKSPDSAQAGVDRFLFGQASSIVREDLYQLIALGGFICLLVFVFLKELKLFTFDSDFLHSIGYPVKRIDLMMTTLLVVVIILGLQFVGVVLIAAMIVAPGAAARQWTNNFTVAILLSMFFGGFSGMAGAWLSTLNPKLPTGPLVVIALSVIVAFSILLSPKRGFLWKLFSKWSARHHAFPMEVLLRDLYALSLQHENPYHQHSQKVLKIMSRHTANTQRILRIMESLNWIRSSGKNTWQLTPYGRELAEKLPQSFDDADTRF